MLCVSYKLEIHVVSLKPMYESITHLWLPPSKGLDGKDGKNGQQGLPGPPGNVFVISVSHNGGR